MNLSPFCHPHASELECCKSETIFYGLDRPDLPAGPGSPFSVSSNVNKHAINNLQDFSVQALRMIPISHGFGLGKRARCFTRNCTHKVKNLSLITLSVHSLLND